MEHVTDTLAWIKSHKYLKLIGHGMFALSETKKTNIKIHEKIIPKGGKSSHKLSPIKSLKKTNILIFELFLLSLLLFSLNNTIITPPKNHSHLNGAHEFIRFIWLSSPVITFYLALRLLRAPAISSTCITLVVIYIFYYINSTKTALTGEPISFNDIFSGVNLSIAIKYISFKTVVSTLALFALVTLIIFTENRYLKNSGSFAFLIIASLITIPLTFTPYFKSIFGESSSLTQQINILSQGYDVTYYSWDWPRNVSAHGLPMHLIQTSVRKSIPSADLKERTEFEKNYNIIPSLNQSSPNKIIYILCESCWYDNDNFKEYFTPLLKSGYKTFRATSPVYGGGTANAEFEFLTGLPSNSGVLSGIIYQEYSQFIKNNASTLPRNLHDLGYSTIAVHNNISSFWRRNIIYKKFGFDKFISLTEMGGVPQEHKINREQSQWQPDDFILYNSILDEIKKNKNKKIFFHAITMSTHGPYQRENDYGQKAYSLQLKEAIYRLTEFTQNLAKIDQNAIIIVYGDHKPALNRYFYEHKTLPLNLFAQTGEEDSDFIFKGSTTPKDIGDVPVFIKGGDEEVLNKLISDANGKPFFCISAIVDKYLLKSGLFSFNYNLQHGCMQSSPYDYHQMISITPPWVYSLTLFK